MINNRTRQILFKIKDYFKSIILMHQIGVQNQALKNCRQKIYKTKMIKNL
jgi:hypothetical protein